jgi:hypothetical protein
MKNRIYMGNGGLMRDEAGIEDFLDRFEETLGEI